jgi:hypothetical protein
LKHKNESSKNAGDVKFGLKIPGLNPGKDELCTISTYSVFLTALKDTMVWQFTISVEQDPSSETSNDHFKKALYFREAHWIRTYSQNPASGPYPKQS